VQPDHADAAAPAPSDFEAEGLLDGLDDDQRAERLELLQQLAAEGIPSAELRRSTEEGTIVFLAADRVIAGRERYTAEQIVALSGIEPELLVALRRAMGLPVPDPGEPSYTRADLEATRMAETFRKAGIPEQGMLDLTRTLGRGLSQAAETMRAHVLQLVLEPGLSEQQLARRYAVAAAEMSPMVGPLITNLLTLQLRQMAESEAVSAAERTRGRLPGAREMTICFADLVGFTRLGETVAPDRLSELAVRLEQLATDALTPPVRLVKTIGDAVMLSSPEPQALIGQALDLVEAADAEGEQFPQLRAGLAYGPALGRAGDWFGRPVNLASRITAIARPGSVLTDSALQALAREQFTFSYAGERRLHGVRGRVALYRARPRAPEGASASQAVGA
jgi:adenylate cyclase